MIFTIQGEPHGKGRPRVTRGGKHTYTPKKTKEYENLVKQSFIAECGNQEPFETHVKMSLYMVFKVPKSASKKNRELMLNGTIRPTKKPDIDNIIKSVADGLNGLAYLDDKQIVEIKAIKWYGENPRINVVISKIDICI